MANLQQVLSVPKARIEALALGDNRQDPDPDIIAFTFASAFALALAIAALIMSFFYWFNTENILFAMPRFPTMGDCKALEAYAANPIIPPNRDANPSIPAIVVLYISDNADPSSPETQAALQIMVDECHYNERLFVEYGDLAREMATLPNFPNAQSDAADILSPQKLTDSMKGLLKVFSVTTSLLGIYVLWVLKRLQKNNPNYERDFNGLGWENILLNLVLAVLAYFGVDVIWFFVERALSQPLIYEKDTCILFITLLVGVFSFLYYSWILKLEITDLSLFMGLLLMVGLIVGMLLTNHIWNVGVTNAYSTMSEIAYPERLSYYVAETDGSRGIFRVTFITAGLLFVVYGMRLKEIVARKKASADASITRLMSPKGVFRFSALAGLLLSMVGIFPLDGIFNLDNSEHILGLTEDVSGALHFVGAYGSPLVVMCMILSFWYIGYPQGNGKDKFLPASSYFWFSVSSVAIMWYLVGRFLSNTSDILALVFVFVFALFVIAAVYIANQIQTGQWHWFSLDLSTYSPFLHWFVALLLGLILGLIMPTKMTTVSLEFVVLLVFSLFIYSYSKYIVEYE